MARNNNKRYRIDDNDDNSNNQIKILLKRIEYLEANNNKLQIQNNNLQNQIIELNNNINIIKDTNNSYNKVFNNIYIRRIIFNYLNKFNTLYPVNIEFHSSKEFLEFKYKEYLNRITLNFYDDQFELNQLPMNIKHITILSREDPEHYQITQVPDHIESVDYFVNEIKHMNSLSKQPHSSKIKTLKIKPGIIILPNQIPNSVTDLIVLEELSNKILPSNLKKLSIRNLESFEDNYLQIPSLTHICIKDSDPFILHQLSISFKNLVKLEFSYENAIIDSDIQFPHNLKELIIQCYSFNYNKSRINTNKICPIQFPFSLEILSIVTSDSNDDDSDKIYFELLPPNLKSLKFPLSSIVDDKGQSILPNKLEKLVTYGEFNEELQVNQLPSTLTHLDLGSDFDQVIDVNVLPTNLNTLILNFPYSQVINPLAIPQQLKLLKINNNDYSHPINLTSSTHPNTAITCHDIHLYYYATSPDYNQIRVLRLPDCFNSPLSTLQLQNKSNLEYLHLGCYFNRPIELSDLPTQNNIRTLELSYEFSQTINLEHFQNLETLIIPHLFHSYPTIMTNTTTIIDEQQQQHIHYNNYKLKSIMVSPKNVKFLKQLDINFYQFIKYNNK